MDYKLNQIYSSIINNNNKDNKTTFRSLTESYVSIYEQDENTVEDLTAKKIQIDVTKPVLELQKWSVPDQANLYRASAGKKEQDLAPDVESSSMESETGVGPGEYAVASVLTGSTDFNVVKKLISGQSKDFDVTWPSGDAPKPEYTFEVKKIEKGSVRIAKHGAKFTNEIIKDVTEILSSILDDYEVLHENSKDEVNGYILASLPELKETKKEDRKKMAHRINWTVDKWARGIMANTRELPFTVLFSDKEPILKRGDDESAPAIRVLISLKTFGDFVTQAIEYMKKDSDDVETSEDNTRIRELKTKFKEFYGAPSSEKSSVIDNEINKTAEQVDKKLNKLKVQQTGEGKSNTEDFFKSINKLKISEKLSKLQKKVQSDESIKSLFPKHLTGLFIVNSQGYRYIPYNDLAKYIEVDKISSGGPKIKLKENADVQTVPSGEVD